MWYQIRQYLKFLIRSKNQHGIHSPFVFNLITKCFYDKTKFKAYSKLKTYRLSLLKDKNLIEVSDLGAGSHTMKTGIRRISRIARYSGTKFKRAKLLFRLTKYLNCKTILELGTSLGIGTHALSLGNPKAKIITIEGCSNMSKFSEYNFKKNWLDNIDILTGNFDEIIQQLDNNAYNLIYFDGNHQKESTLKYFDILLNTAHNDSVFIFDDIYWSKGMTEAWAIIKQHPKVTVTIDIFFWGLVFFRKEQAKQHFTIRM